MSARGRDEPVRVRQRKRSAARAGRLRRRRSAARDGRLRRRRSAARDGRLRRRRSAARDGRLRRRRFFWHQPGISSGELEVFMKRLLLACLVLVALAAPALAAEQTVSFKSGDESVNGFLAAPEGKGPFPAVIVIHEWWGLDDWVKGQARALAQEGYVALAVDLYRGKVTNKQEEAHQLMMGLPRDRALRDLKAAFAYFQGRADVR